MGLVGSEVAALPEARSRQVDGQLQASADRRARKAAVKIKFGNLVRTGAGKLGQRLDDVRAQAVRDSWE